MIGGYLRKLAALVAAIVLEAVAGSGLAAAEGDAAKGAAAESTPASAAEMIARGKQLYHTLTCVRCHGSDMVQNSSAAFDLRTFPHDDKARFVNSVTKGKNNRMPPWGDVLKPEEIEQLWAYVQSGGRK